MIRFLLCLGFGGSLLGLAGANAEPTGEAPFVRYDSPIGELSWRPGKGLRLGDTGAILGGYTSLEGTRPEGEAGRASVEALSFLVSWDPLWKLHLFSELEFERLGRIDSRGRIDAEGSRFEIERAYGEFTYSDRIGLRAGKLLTPFGRWNTIHAAPLVWTTSRPLVTDFPFDENTTGASLFGTVFGRSGSLGWQLYGQFLDPLEPTPQPIRQERAAGGHLELTLVDGPAVGASVLVFRDREGRWHRMGGTDAAWTAGRFDLLAEAAIDGAERESRIRWGLYLQLAARAVGAWHAVGRYEYFDPGLLGVPVHLAIPGLAWRPFPWLIAKGEYRFADRSSRIGAAGPFASLALLF